MQINKMELTVDIFPILKTDRLDLVEIKQSHLADLYKLFSDENVTRFYNLLPLTNEQEAQKSIDWFQSRFKDKLGIRWGIAIKGQKNIIGTIGFNNFTKRHRANIGYDLQTEHWNNGYITEALKTVINFGFDQLEINRIEAEVMQGNIISEKVLDKLNFKNEGILREWMFWNDKHYDMTMFSLLKADYGTKQKTNA
jgi:ribosomal-protein-alanine N-acetyltransferase